VARPHAESVVNVARTFTMRFPMGCPLCIAVEVSVLGAPFLKDVARALPGASASSGAASSGAASSGAPSDQLPTMQPGSPDFVWVGGGVAGRFSAWPKSSLYNQRVICKIAGHVKCVQACTAKSLPCADAFAKWLLAGRSVETTAQHKALWKNVGGGKKPQGVSCNAPQADTNTMSIYTEATINHKMATDWLLNRSPGEFGTALRSMGGHFMY
jgi:hypothetical protein